MTALGGLNGPLANVPHYVYRFFAEDGSLLYVGATSNIGQRVSQHAGEKDWWLEVRGFEAEWFPNMREALDAERAVIEATQPKHNGTYTDRYDAGGHQRRRAEREAAHAAGNLCRQHICKACNAKAHDLGMTCFSSRCGECADLMPWYYADEPNKAAAWRELATRFGGYEATGYSIASAGPVVALAEVEDGMTLQEIRRAHAHMRAPVTRRRKAIQ